MLGKIHIINLKRLFCIFFFFLIFAVYNLEAQSTRSVQLPHSISTSDVLKIVQDSFDYSFSYRSTLIKGDKLLAFKEDKKLKLLDILEEMADSQNINFNIANGRKILLTPKKKEEKFRWLTGFAYDKNSLEPVPEIYITTTAGKTIGVTDADGRYRVKININQDSLLFDGISYEPLMISVSSVKDRQDVLISIKDLVIPITITSSQFDNLFSPKIELNFSDIDLSKGLLGDENPLEEVLSLSGVNSGNEGQTGLYVRGGTPDQNLILYNGVPLYEISHIAGLSSIFMNKNISTIDVYKSAIPAKYGGRLSSVLDIQSVRGDKLKYTGEASASLSSLQASLEGPIIKEQASFSVSARKSIINAYVDPLLGAFIDFEDLNLDYQDFNIGVNFNISDYDELHLFAYSGRDNILIKTESGENSDFSLTDETAINWGTDLIGVNYKRIIGNNIFLKSGVSWSDYDFESRASYTYTDPDNLDTGNAFLDVLSLSSVQDENAFINLDIFLADRFRIDLGATVSLHEYNPAVQQSTVILEDDEVATIKGDSTLSARETTLYASTKIDINDDLYIEAGALLSSFEQDDTYFQDFQPRFSLVSRLSDHFAYVVSAGRTVQYTHLLQNSGTGLPSDLWVPSGSIIDPELADRIALDIKYRYEDRFTFSMSAYYRQTENAILYSGSNDLFYSILNRQVEQLVFDEPRSWEEEVTRGRSFTQGLEFQFSYDSKQFSFFGGYTLAKVEMQFDAIDDGVRFPARHDRRHDLTINSRIYLNKNWSFLAHFIYGSGNAYSLALEEIITINGERILVNADRNAFRYPAYHHLDLYVDYNRRYRNGELSINFGVYNVYNRLNPFYVYLFDDTIKDETRLRQISLFPILPSLRLKFSF